MAGRGPNDDAPSRLLLSSLVLGACLVSAVQAQGPRDLLTEGFHDPPKSARPQVWWNWMNGNISDEGARADLERFRSIGLGGIRLFEAGLGTPTVVPHRIVYMSPAWEPASGAVPPQFGPPPPMQYAVSEVRFDSGPRVTSSAGKAGFATLPDYYAAAAPPAAGIDPSRVFDITGRSPTCSATALRPARRTGRKACQTSSDGGAATIRPLGYRHSPA